MKKMDFIINIGSKVYFFQHKKIKNNNTSNRLKKLNFLRR